MNYSKSYINDLIQPMKKFLEDIAVQEPEIIAVYLFGSFAGDKARRSSDVDLAFLFERAFYKHDPYRAFAIVQITGAEDGRKDAYG